MVYLFCEAANLWLSVNKKNYFTNIVNGWVGGSREAQRSSHARARITLRWLREM